MGLLAFSPATLLEATDEGTGPPPDLRITTPCLALEFDAGTLECSPGAGVFSSLAFDADGALWTSTYASPGGFEVAAYSRAQLQNGRVDDQPAPARTILFDESFIPGALAFDANRALWVGGAPNFYFDAGVPNLRRFPVEELALDGGSTRVAPDINITVPADPSLSLAFSPIPPGLPIQP